MIGMKQSRLYDPNSRTRQAKKILAVLTDYFGSKKLKGLSVLDVGCGSGLIDVYLAPRVRTQARTQSAAGSAS